MRQVVDTVGPCRVTPHDPQGWSGLVVLRPCQRNERLNGQMCGQASSHGLTLVSWSWQGHPTLRAPVPSREPVPGEIRDPEVWALTVS